MSLNIDESKIEAIGKILNNPERPMKERYRALFTLKNIGGKKVIELIAQAFSDSSELLKHECGYCLGQMGDTDAIPYLVNVLTDTKQEPIVRHEAGEALGAIGSVEVLELLRKHCSDPVVEVAETCQLAVRRIEWLQKQKDNPEKVSDNPYLSVDPAPPEVIDKASTEQLKSELLDETLLLFQRYRALFSLRNKGDDQSILAIGEGLKAKNALFRHEVAYVLGQISSELSVDQLSSNLRDLNEHPMVRHECAEALGSIATDPCNEVLEVYRTDSQRVVRESCEVALDMCDYAQTEEFQYANMLQKVTS